VVEAIKSLGHINTTKKRNEVGGRNGNGNGKEKVGSRKEIGTGQDKGHSSVESRVKSQPGGKSK